MIIHQSKGDFMDTFISKTENHFQTLDEITDKRGLAISKQSAMFDKKLQSLRDDVNLGEISARQAREILPKTIYGYQQKVDSINSYYDEKRDNVLSKVQQFFEDCTLDSHDFTVGLSKCLSNETGRDWLPIRFLVSCDERGRGTREAYGVILEEALLSLPNMTETMTLLKTDKFVPRIRYNLKYSEDDYKYRTNYECVDINQMNYIWDLSSYNFLSITDNKKFNPILNLNETNDKPFLHLALSRKSQNVLKSLPKQYPMYRHYNLPDLPQNHPRVIANKFIESQLMNKLEKVQSQPQI